MLTWIEFRFDMLTGCLQFFGRIAFDAARCRSIAARQWTYSTSLPIPFQLTAIRDRSRLGQRAAERLHRMEDGGMRTNALSRLPSVSHNYEVPRLPGCDLVTYPLALDCSFNTFENNSGL